MDILNWLAKWLKSNSEDNEQYKNQIKIYTVDNPGWVVKIDLKNTILENLEIKYHLIEKSENDWYGISIENSIFDGAGDQTKLHLLLEKFKELVEKTKPVEISENEVLDWLVKWFESNCDGDWEHENGVQIYTTDHSSWVVEIELTDTSIESLDIDYKLNEKSDQDWYGFSIKKAIFKASGDLTKLEFLLKIFREIVDANSRLEE